MSFQTVLVANRGEIALRVIEACRELRIRSIAVYSEADEPMPYLKLADGAVCIGPAEAARSYLNAAAIISVAELVEADAIHPGYGFLAENPGFVEICNEHGIRFIGPSLTAMRIVGDKVTTRECVAAAGVPVLPGGLAPRKPEDATAMAEAIGYPILIKSVYGGGGRGLRWVETPGELVAALAAAEAEAKAASGEGHLYLEKAVRDPRHVEVQVLGDERGRIITLGERDCSIQRRHQKLIEESPAPNLPTDTRERLRRAALVTAHAVGYWSAGTVEFLVAPDGAFYFIEMNARIQVEHSVTEVACRINLIREQIEIAAGGSIPLDLEATAPCGHAIECRLNAEDPTRGFLPSTGVVHIDELPGGHGIRLDTALYDGMTVSPHYDSLLAKLIAWGEDRDEAIVRMQSALRRFRISGVATTKDLALRVVSHPSFRDAELSTSFLDKNGLLV
ncbi:MAG: biotin carboxylase N-terminal domain-containing protein [Candidatus Bipolaricaulis sp.]|nr:biotin carboxylase N-terminal domain-containing protein [Candidatus Bipolaricaulis sp.]